jgi:vacuolar-type H+-ATPase subunit E/Vma4
MTMSENEERKSRLAEEFERLGSNIQLALQSAWESDERKRLAAELKQGLRTLSEAVEDRAEEIAESPAAERIRGEVDEFAENVRSGELIRQLREDLAKALDKVNAEIEKFAGSRQETPPAEGGEES